MLLSHPEHGVEGAANLVGGRWLERFELQAHVSGRARAQPRRSAKRRSDHAAFDSPGGCANVVEGQLRVPLASRMSASCVAKADRANTSSVPTSRAA